MDISWEALKIEYITTKISQRKLAEKYGIPYSTIRHRCTVEKWAAERKRYCSKVVAKATAKTADKEAAKLAKLINATEKLSRTVERALEDPDQLYRHLVDRSETYVGAMVESSDDGETVKRLQSKDWTEEQVFKKMDTRALRDLVGAIKDLASLMRDFYNIPTPAQAEAQRIAAERLELDKRKAEAADNDIGTVEVIFSAGPEEWNE